MNFSHRRQLSISFAQAIEGVKAGLQQEGFGILSEIDVQSTLKKKLNVEYNKYVILGACNPSFAFQALQAEKDIGLLLPCNIIVYEAEGHVHASAILPSVTMGVVGLPSVAGVAAEVEKRLKKVIDSL